MLSRQATTSSWWAASCLAPASFDFAILGVTADEEGSEHRRRVAEDGEGMRRRRSTAISFMALLSEKPAGVFRDQVTLKGARS